MSRLLRDPLVHFILLGGLIYAAFAVLAPGGRPDGPSDIEVTRAALLEFIQHRTSNFNADAVGAWLDERTPDQLQAIIDDYVVEERTYREALALGLDKADYAIKQRLVQQMDYLRETDPAAHETTAGEYDIILSPEITTRLAENTAP